MPLYEFRCEECGTFFEKLVNQIENQISCIQCDSKRVKKQFSVFATRGSTAGGGDEPPASCNSCTIPEKRSCGYNPR